MSTLSCVHRTLPHCQDQDGRCNCKFTMSSDGRPAPQGFFGDDCSSEATHLEYDVPVSKAEANFEYDFFQLPDISPAMFTHSVEVRIQASYWSSGYGEWAAARPELLLLKVCTTVRCRRTRHSRVGSAGACQRRMPHAPQWWQYPMFSQITTLYLGGVLHAGRPAEPARDRELYLQASNASTKHHLRD